MKHMTKLFFDKYSWKCEKCKNMIALPGIVPSLEMIKEQGWKHCPYCGKTINFDESEVSR